MAATGWSFADLTDFVEGGRSVLTGRQVYDPIPGVLPFNYPPFGAVVMVPLARVGLGRPCSPGHCLPGRVRGFVIVIGRRLGFSVAVTAAVAVGAWRSSRSFGTSSSARSTWCLRRLSSSTSSSSPRGIEGSWWASPLV